ncbi:NADH dehydrogenase [ubiquinone] iron-sulfur protein 4, mitochondrial-like [Artemia franciscana]|uniref:NADH dehydrogenase [ubiquinone] iron-sulfur protein 4, mitochondrial n=1 Tax=Artemia franciscana TaxID=6661 RepID=A0AA88HXF7_ARTSF|nr:hypothetical protein QYM36_006043 [Artemia franciscana]
MICSKIISRNSTNLIKLGRSLTTSAIVRSDVPSDVLKVKEAPVKEIQNVLQSPEKLKLDEDLKKEITIEGVENVGIASSIPEEHIKTRRVRIYKPVKHAMQSGTAGTGSWMLEFDTRERWENPLMGWTSRRSLTTSAIVRSDVPSDVLKVKEAPVKEIQNVLQSPEKLKHDEDLKKEITIEGVENVGIASSIPEEHIKTRRVRIYKPVKHAMQSGTAGTGSWMLEFDTRERWENPLMGWTSSGDPMSNLVLQFSSKDDAIAYCEKMGYSYDVFNNVEKKVIPKSYGANFSWNKRTRNSTK